jgi:hypothetical protein
MTVGNESQLWQASDLHSKSLFTRNAMDFYNLNAARRGPRALVRIIGKATAALSKQAAKSKGRGRQQRRTCGLLYVIGARSVSYGMRLG